MFCVKLFLFRNVIEGPVAEHDEERSEASVG